MNTDPSMNVTALMPHKKPRVETALHGFLEFDGVFIKQVRTTPAHYFGRMRELVKRRGETSA